MTYDFKFGDIDVRSSLSGNKPVYSVKGYAVIPEMKHVHKYFKDTNGKVSKSLRSVFTKNFEKSMYNQLRNKKIFIDTEHEIASKLNIKKVVDQMVDNAKSAGLDMTQAKDIVNTYLNVNEIPMFKVHDFKIDENGMFVEIRGNPFFRELDDDHKNYFDAIWGSLEDKFLGGLSINFTPTKVVEERDELGVFEKIDDGQVYGISILGQPAIDGANITEVAIRALQDFKGETKMVGMKTVETKTNTPVEPTVVEKVVEKRVEDTAKIEAMQKELESLKAENAQYKQEKVNAEKTAQDDLMKNMQTEISQLKESLTKQQNAPQHSEVSQQHPNQGQGAMNADQVKNKLDNLSFGEALQLQADFKVNQNLPPQTRYLVNKSGADVLVRKQS